MKNFVIVALLVLLTGCVQTPTRNTQTVDDRPGVTFNLIDTRASSYELRVDDVSYGRVGQYQEGKSLLKLVDGTHRVELLDGSDVVFSKKVYLGAGANRVIKVRAND